MYLKVLIISAVLVNLANTQNCESHQKCIDERRCNPEGKVRTDGAGLLMVRFAKSCGMNKVCCQYKRPSILDRLVEASKCGVRVSSAGPRIPDFFNVDRRLVIEGSKDDIKHPDADLGEFPWMVLVLNYNESKYNRRCGGSLIKSNVVLTSAHNVQDIEAQDLIARAGEYDIENRNEMEKSEELQVITVIMHEDFNKKNLDNDIALLILEESFTLSAHINVICLPPQDTVFDGERCTVSGWGKSKFGPNGIDHNILKRIDLPMVLFAKCDRMLKKSRLGRKFQLPLSFICAGGELNKDACTGDGGSPLICPIPETSNEYYQAGIVSWGIGCGQENVPGVYTNVAMFSEWIENQSLEN